MGSCCFSSENIHQDRRALPHSISMIPVKKMFKFGKTLGGGSFGIVKLAHGINDKDPVAIKIIPKEKVQHKLSVLRREIDILLAVDHPNIIRLLNVFEDGEKIYLIMDYCSGGELFSKITSKGMLSEEESKKIMRKILMAINHLHCKKIVHRDLKPQHILFDKSGENGEVKIIDFGLSSKLVNPLELMHSQVGTIYYTAPEVITGNYDDKCDMWSAGIILYTMLSGNMPFYGRSIQEVSKSICIGNFSMEGGIWDQVTENAKNLIHKLIVKDPSTRLSAAEAIQHPWFDSHNESTSEIDSEIIESLKNYRKTSAFQREAVNILIKHLPETHMVPNVRSSFLALDKTDTGQISKGEFSKIMLDHNLNEEEIDELSSAIDIRNSGNINYSEFIAALISGNKMDEDMIKRAFECLDIENKGYIVKNDFKIGAINIGKELSNEEYEKISENFGEINDRITYDQFKTMMGA